MTLPQSELDQKLSCVAESLAVEMGAVLRCMIEQQVAAKRLEIEQSLQTLRTLESLLNGNLCSSGTADNP